MRKLILLSLSTLLLGVLPLSSDAQILREIVRKAGNRLENKAEDMIAEAIAEAVARQLQKKIDTYFEDLAKETYRQDSIRAAENGDTLAYHSYQEMLEQMLDNETKVRDEYLFDLALEVEIASGKEVNQSHFLYAQDKPYFAVQQAEKGQNQYLVFDLQNQLIVLFSESEKEEKTAQALPWLPANNVIMAANETVHYPGVLTQTGQKKTIAGYVCDQYLAEDDDYRYELYTSPDLADYWQASMGQFMQRFTSYSYQEALQKTAGMPMESIASPKQNQNKPKLRPGKQQAPEIDPNSDIWRVIKVNLSEFRLQKADYSFLTP